MHVPSISPPDTHIDFSLCPYACEKLKTRRVFQPLPIQIWEKCVEVCIDPKFDHKKVQMDTTRKVKRGTALCLIFFGLTREEWFDMNAIEWEKQQFS